MWHYSITSTSPIFTKSTTISGEIIHRFALNKKEHFQMLLEQNKVFNNFQDIKVTTYSKHYYLKTSGFNKVSTWPITVKEINKFIVCGIPWSFKLLLSVRTSGDPELGELGDDVRYTVFSVDLGAAGADIGGFVLKFLFTHHCKNTGF